MMQPRTAVIRFRRMILLSGRERGRYLPRFASLASSACRAASGATLSNLHPAAAQRSLHEAQKRSEAARHRLRQAPKRHG